MGQTIVEKIATRHAVGLGPGQKVFAGDYVTIRPKHLMTHDNTAAIIPKFESIGATKIAAPDQPVFAIDHDIQNTSEENLSKYARIRSFAKKHGVDFYPPGAGIGHQIMIEQGYVIPGSMVVASDSHSNIYGAIAALGTPVVRTDAASIWATGRTWWQVPRISRVRLEGGLRSGATGKDVILALCGFFDSGEVLNHVVEFYGEGLASLSMDDRMSIANMTTEWGALAGVFPFDDTLRDYLYERASHFEATGRPVRYTRRDVDEWWDGRQYADEDASWAADLEIDLSSVSPCVAGPGDVKTVTPLSDIAGERIAIHKAWLVGCANARLSDLEKAAAVLERNNVAAGVKFYVAAASEDIQKQAQVRGVWKCLVGAGAIVLPPGCGPCIGLGEGTIEKGEIGISATNRNFRGRMGSSDASVYLASPAVVAASAVAGYICAPGNCEATQIRASINVADVPASDHQFVEILEGFPEKIAGRVLFMDRDNLNTDGIYAGKWTYKDNMGPAEMARVVFENYDGDFSTIYRRGDIIVSGSNFGTGSSREQAATALGHRGIPCVIAASFSQTYKRNAFNNAFPVIESPGLVAHLRGVRGASVEPTVAGPAIEIDFRSSVIRCDGGEFSFTPLGAVPQELIVAGGAEALVKKRLGI